MREEGPGLRPGARHYQTTTGSVHHHGADDCHFSGTGAQDGSGDWPETIAEPHREMLRASGITPEHAALRGYKTISDPRDLAQIGIAKAGQRTRGLLIPLLRKDGSVRGYQYRPDHPRQHKEPRSTRYRAIKYETPHGQSNCLDVPPGVGPLLGDPSVPLFITEGVKKADCAVLRGQPCVALTGVWNWRATNAAGGKTAIPDFHDIALNDRRVVVAPDSDCKRKPSVHKAVVELGGYLASKGAEVGYLCLPDDADGETGLDDFLIAEHTVVDLWRLVTPNPPPLVREDTPPADPTGDPGSSGADGSRFFDRDGLRARDLAEEVMRRVVCGVGEVDDRLYTYELGVWLPNDGRIEAQIVALLGNRYRNAHSRNVLDLIRYSPRITRISCGPVPEYVNVPNGMVSWADGTLLPHSPDYRSTVQLPVVYDPDAQCPRFEKYLAEVLPKDLYEPDDESPCGFIWEVIGYALYSGNPLHLAVLFCGKGRNGKGVLIRVLKGLLGEQNCSMVSLHQLVENRFRAAKLFGKLANLAGDLDSRWLDNTAVFKAVTGGDTIQGEHKYGMPFDFTPWALPIYSANKPFGSADSSEGWVARWLVVPFPSCFIGREDRGLDARLQTDDELRGILRRGIEALPSLMRRGRFTEPKSVREAKRAFVVASDPVRAWLDECCVIEFEAWTARKDLHQVYWGHTLAEGSKQLSSREFYNRIEQVNGIRRAIREGIRGFAGIRLRAYADPRQAPPGTRTVQKVQVPNPLPRHAGKRVEKVHLLHRRTTSPMPRHPPRRSSAACAASRCWHRSPSSGAFARAAGWR